MLNCDTEIIDDSEISFGPFYQGFEFLSILIYISVNLHLLVEVISKERFRGLTSFQVPCCLLTSSNKEHRAETTCRSLQIYNGDNRNCLL